MSDLKELHDSFVFCRTYGHSWQEIPRSLDRKPTVFKWYTPLRCTRCSTERYDGESPLGDVVQRAYTYPDGYSLAGRLTRAQFRLELRRRKGRRTHR